VPEGDGEVRLGQASVEAPAAEVDIGAVEDPHGVFIAVLTE
jgi:hypothetical protein